MKPYWGDPEQTHVLWSGGMVVRRGVKQNQGLIKIYSAE
jgi:hypothetical protein